VYRISGGDPQSAPVLQKAEAPFRLAASVAPVWSDDQLLFFDEDGSLCACVASDDGPTTPRRISETRFLGVRGFAVSPSGVLVSHGRGLSKLSLGGRLMWQADASMEPIGGSPIIAGGCGIGVSRERNILYICDFQGPALSFQAVGLPAGLNRTSPAFCDNVVYSCSSPGVVSAVRIVVSA
jgi:hypothetical protein